LEDSKHGIHRSASTIIYPQILAAESCAGAATHRHPRMCQKSVFLGPFRGPDIAGKMY
jgi:hypothetical protein